MNIFFTGAFGTGKDTIINDLCDLKRYAFKPISWNRRTFHSEYKDNYYVRQVIPVIKWIESLNELKNIERSLQEAELPCAINLFNRGLIDSLVYFRLLREENKIDDNFLTLGELLFDEYSRVMKDPTGAVFYLPIEFDIVDDGFRPLDNSLQRRVDELTLAVMTEKEIPFIKLSGSREERVQKVTSVLETLGVSK